MKTILSALMTLPLAGGLFAQSNTVEDSVVLDAQFINTSFYKMSSGETQNILNQDWDIAFEVIPFSLANVDKPRGEQIFGASIIINSVAGVELYTMPDGGNSTDPQPRLENADTSEFNNGTGPGWRKMYNTDTSWNMGAFNINRTRGDLFDFGWGRYGFVLNNHKVEGDSIFLLKTRNGSYKKMIIDSLNGGVWYFRYCNVDNSELVSFSISKDLYNTPENPDDEDGKTFVYYSIEDKQIDDPEPVKSNWDIQFVRYSAYQNDGSYRTKVGVLTNELWQVTSGEDNESSFHNAQQPTVYHQNISLIGYDWNSWNPGEIDCRIIKPTVYFVKDPDGVVYKMQFTDCNAVTGTIKFIKERVGAATYTSGYGNPESYVHVYPNPAKNYFTVAFDNQINEANVTVRLADLNGKVVASENRSVEEGLNRLNFNNQLPSGVYFVNVFSSHTNYTQKVIVY